MMLFKKWFRVGDTVYFADTENFILYEGVITKRVGRLADVHFTKAWQYAICGMREGSLDTTAGVYTNQLTKNKQESELIIARAMSQATK